MRVLFKVAVVGPTYVWTEGQSVQKELRFQKYPDTCGRGLSWCYTQRNTINSMQQTLYVIYQGRRKMFQVRGGRAPKAREPYRWVRGHAPPEKFWFLTLWNAFSCILGSVLIFKIILVYLYFLRQYLTFLETNCTWLHWSVCETCVRASATCPRNFLKSICSEDTSGAI